MTLLTAAEFRELTLNESRTLLANNSVGRLAFTLHDRVDIAPISYANDDAWIFGRTSKGAKLASLLHHPWCAFEVDEVRGPFDWSSVVVKGSFHLLDPEIGSPDTYQRAEAMLRDLVPGTFSVDDPAPHRDIVFGIFIQEITGRTAGPVDEL